MQISLKNKEIGFKLAWVVFLFKIRLQLDLTEPSVPLKYDSRCTGCYCLSTDTEKTS